MSEKEKAKQPLIRFTGFTGDGAVARVYGNIIFESISNKKHTSDLPILAITQEQGAIPRDLIDYKVCVTNKSIASYKVVEVGDFIISLRSFQGGIEYSLFHGICSPAYIILRKRINIAEQYYKHYFKTDKFIQDLNKNLEGIRDGKMVSYSQFSSILLPHPSLPEQTKIGTFFSTLDTLITLHQRKCDLLEQTKQTYLQQLFPREGERVPELRFAGFDGDWEEKKLGEVSERVRGNDGRMDLPTLTISAGSGWLDQRERFSGNIAGKEQANYTLLSKGQLSYNHGNSKLAKYGAVFELRAYQEALVPRVYHSFETTEDASARFIEYMFATKNPDKELAKLISSGARMDGLLNINYNEFMNISITITSLPEQQKIGTFFSHLDTLITHHKEKLTTLKAIKQTLLGQMFV